MPRKSTPSFVTEIPLKINSAEHKELLARFSAAQQLYNALLGEVSTRMKLMKVSEDYLQAKTLKGDKNKALRNSLFDKARKTYRFSDFDLQSFAVRTANSSNWIAKKLDSNTIQKLATRAFKAVERVLLGKAEKVRFKSKNRIKSVEGKTNKQGLRWTISYKKRTRNLGKKTSYCNKIKCSENILYWLGLELEPIIDWFDPVIAHGLNSPIKYCRLLWRNINGKKRWYVQLINEGLPYQKPKNFVTDGNVGLDLNISNVAFVADYHAGLLPFAEGVPVFQREITLLQRKMQRSQRKHNPNNYKPDFDIKVGNRIVTKKGKFKAGKQQWIKTSNYLRTAAKKAELERRKAAYSKSQNRKLVNEILRHGNRIKTENVSVKGWQKRYGKAIAAKSPGYFQSELARKAESAGGKLTKFSTQKTALSQTHLDGTRIKKKLSDRVHYDVTGIKPMHRDLFSAYLARCTYGDVLSLRDAQWEYSDTEPYLSKAWQQYKQASSE